MAAGDGRTLKARRVLWALAAAAFSWPSASFAAQVPVFSAGPVRVRGYELTVVAAPAAVRGGAPEFQLALDRHGSAGSDQNHTFGLSRGLRFTVARDLRSARLRANLGRYGLVELTVTRAAPKRGHGCYTRIHTGVARGTLKLAPGGAYFGTIKLGELPVAIGVPHGCETRHRAFPATAPVPVLSASWRAGSRRGPLLVWSASSDLSVTFMRARGRVRVEDTIGLSALPAGALTSAPDLTSASLRGVGPFLSGVANYMAAAGPRPVKPPRCQQTSGRVSGALTALFDTPGPVALVGPTFTADLAC